ncbi:MAG: Purine nucleosidase/pyrimidine-specific ribonucleoside hydrolase [Cohnella sp.]|nr:Purine nucleosidase/pyrimidine-specific ribonucleoside hydrolase [Cohnella sp.]
MTRIPVIIDTDIGDDIDDALAIAFALGCPELELLGVTTVLGNTAARARIAARLLQEAYAGSIPVHAGCGQPIRQSADTFKVPCQYLPGEMDELPVADLHAVDFIIETALRSPEPITLLTIGPLTNAAVALLREPRLREKLRRIVMMGGAYYFHYVEWNVYCDPEAADIVFRSGTPITAVGLDVTKRCLMSHTQLDRLSRGNTPVTRLLLGLIGMWQADTGRRCPILHDALAVYGAINGGLLGFEREAVSVELSGARTRGLTFNLTDRDREEQLVTAALEMAGRSVVEVANRVEAELFVELFLDRVLSSR